MLTTTRRHQLTTAAALAFCGALLSTPLCAQTSRMPATSVGFLHDLNASVEDLTARVAASVVQVMVTGYGPVDDRSNGDTGMMIGPQRSMGSGAIIDADGYIITNAHVVAGARRVQVVLQPVAAATGGLGSLNTAGVRTVDARIVGVAADIDLALLRVDVTGLQAIPLADYDALRQGQLVFAFGSPEGLRNSVSMGVVSAVARQPDPDRPTIYVQTDAPINRGNSGGPLVNVDGQLVGLNTFILSDSGGSQGLGFAIPSSVVASAYPQLRKFGHLHRGMIGVNFQAITPALADGLGLARQSGVMVSDVQPDGAADAAGIEIQDVVATLNGKPVDNVPTLSLELGLAAAGDTVSFGILRGTRQLAVNVNVRERPQAMDELADPEVNGVPALGIVGADIPGLVADLLPDLRIQSGVLVTARTQTTSGIQAPLLAGDVIHSVNTYPVRSLDGLRVLLNERHKRGTVVLQIERNGQLQFVTCELN
jgi:serine protease Do